MARKNNNAGQPNRSAQKDRRQERLYRDQQHRPFRKVMGPGSPELVRTPVEVTEEVFA